MGRNENNNVCGSLFRAILILFSCVLMVFTMLCTVRLAAMNDKASASEKRIQELSAENDVLIAHYESSIGLDEIEQYATEVLGMQRCTPGQIIYLEAPEAPGEG